MMKLQYLGTAAAEGVPALLCECPVCQNAWRVGGREFRTRSQAIVNDELLIDFGPDTLCHLHQNGIHLSKVHHCLITHAHKDHFCPKELDYFHSGYGKVEEGYRFTVYGSDGVEDYFHDSGIPSRMPSRLSFVRINAYEPFEIGKYRVTALNAVHGTKHPMVYIIEDGTGVLLYGHDSSVFSDETWAYLASLKLRFDLVSLDCTFGANEAVDTKGHMGIGADDYCRQKLIEMGLADGKTKFVLNHFSHNGIHAGYTEMKEIAEQHGFEISYDGMVVTI